MAAIDEMVREVTQELFLSAAVEEAMAAQRAAQQAQGQQPQQEAESEGSADDPDAILRRVVAARIDGLDDTFLATLNVYIAGAQQKGQQTIADLLHLIKEEVLRQIAGRLAPELQVLNAALQAPDQEARLAVVRQHALMEGAVKDQVLDVATEQSGAGTTAQLPYCSMEDLQRAVTQVLDDMEGSLEIIDRRLLARVVLLQDGLQQRQLQAQFLAGGGGEGGGAVPSHLVPGGGYRELGAVPRAVATFVKELVRVGSEERRRALLRKAFGEDWILGAASAEERDDGLEGAASEHAGGSVAAGQGQQGARDPGEAVRPGRFMQGLAALQAEMLDAVAGSGEPVSSAMLERVESIRREAVAVLEDMAGEGPEYRP